MHEQLQLQFEFADASGAAGVLLLVRPGPKCPAIPVAFSGWLPFAGVTSRFGQ